MAICPPRESFFISPVNLSFFILLPMMQSYKNIFLQGVYRLLRKTPHSFCPGKRILVVATTALGDTLWATPALESLRKSFPTCYLAVMTSDVGMALLEGNPWTDRVYRYSPALYFALRREQFNSILIFHASQRLALFLPTLLGSQRIVGTSGLTKKMDWMLTDPLPNVYQHEAERRSRMIEAIGADPISTAPSVFLKEEEVREGTKWMGSDAWIALHPGAKEPFRRWPVEHFAAVANGIRDRRRVLITGTQKERSLMKELQQLIPGSFLLPVGTSIRQLMAALQRVDLLISNDTGPLHLAAALKRPVIGLYTATDPNLCGPYRAEKATILSRPPTCTPCAKKKCPMAFCLLQIGPEEVIKAAKGLL